MKDDLRALIKFSLRIMQMLTHTDSTKAKSYDPTGALFALITWARICPSVSDQKWGNSN